MPDQTVNELPRVALVYGQEAEVAHVREAVGGQVDVVYAATGWMPSRRDCRRPASR